ncbi:MAG: tail fiber domain-containing protein [Opitutae bacterium]|nr:tail fiber domain-containing protein [Opitutae bacterium]
MRLITSSGDLHVDGNIVAYSTTVSDQRLKDDVETIETALDKVGNLRGVTYTWNAGSRKGQRDMGVIAQEVEAVIPEIVREKEMAFIDGETYKTVDYEKLTAVLIEAVKELKAEVDSLKAAQ